MVSKKNTFVVIGIDSATFDVVTPMIKQGKLPNLSSLMRDGASGPLRSTIPPVTPPAWVTFMTGKNPGKHGVFDFYVSPSYGYSRPVWNSKYIKATTIWKILSDRGYRVGMVNMPMTHPPERINGFVIPGVQYSLDGEGEFSHPPELMKEVTDRFGNYRVVYGDLESLYTTRLDRLLEEWRNIFELRRKTILYLMDTKEWDVFTAVFYSLDVMQHHFWRFFDRSHPAYDPEYADRYGGVIGEFYEKIDSAIGEILERVPCGATVLLVSDHGAGPEEEGFAVNNWLAKRGFLKFKWWLTPLWKYRFPHVFYKSLRRTGFKGVAWTVPLDRLASLGGAIDPREGLDVAHFIDWERTRAYGGNHTEQGIYINLKGREPLGIVGNGEECENVREEIIKNLLALEDPRSGGPLLEVYRKEEIYEGPYLSDAPDIFMVMKGGRCLMQKEIHHPGLFFKATKSSGTHRMDGICILWGDRIRAGCGLRDLHIKDMAPTILYSLGLPVPEDMDGRVIVEAFEPGYLESNPVVPGPPTDRGTAGEAGVLDPENTEKVKESLRSLGYFG